MPNNERVTDRSSSGWSAAYEPRQAAIELGVSEEEVQRLVDAGEIKTIGRYLDTRSYEEYRIRRAVERRFMPHNIISLVIGVLVILILVFVLLRLV